MAARTGLDNVIKNQGQIDLTASQQPDPLNTEIDRAVRKALGEATSSRNGPGLCHPANHFPVVGGALNSAVSLTEENDTRPLNVKLLVEQTFRKEFPSSDTQHNGDNGWGLGAFGQPREEDYGSLVVDELKLLNQIIKPSDQ